MKKRRKSLMYILSAIILAVTIFQSSITVEAATQAQIQKCAQELGQILQERDTSSHNILKYNLTPTEFRTLVNDMKKTREYGIIMASYNYNLGFSLNTVMSRVNNIQLCNTSEENIAQYPQIKAIIQSILNGADESMSDLDKVIYFYDTIVDMTTYRSTGSPRVYGANGVFYDNVAVCAGYTRAFNLLLNLSGIETSYVREHTTMNHAWSYIKLDGEWYHADSTWGDTRKGAGDVANRSFLLQNDKAFSAAGTNSHGNCYWVPDDTDEKSASTRFDGWFVHDISGKMVYDNGYWYYVDNNNMLKCSTAEGGDVHVLADGSSLGELTLLSVSNGTAIYTCNGIRFEASIENPSDVSFEEVYDVEEIDDFGDLSNWRSGVYYYTDGKYVSNSHRICLNAYYPTQADTEYTVILSDSNFQMLIREMSEDMKLIASHNLLGGETFTTSSDCAYLAISLYTPSGDLTASYATYEQLFSSSDFAIGLQTEGVEQQPITSEEPEQNQGNEVSETTEDTSDSVVATDSDYVLWDDFSLWKMGNYHYITGEYEALTTRLCLNSLYETEPGIGYSVILTDNNYHMLVRELSSSKQMLVSYNLAPGESFTTSDQCKYLAVSIYSPGFENKCNYNSFQELFQQTDFKIGLYCTTPTESYETQLENADSSVSNLALYWNSISDWRSGLYHWVDGQYVAFPNRICLQDYISATANTTFTVILSDATQHMLIREMDANNQILVSHNLANGDSFTTNADCSALAISMYSPTADSQMTLSAYEQIFEKGITVGIVQAVEIEDGDTPLGAYPTNTPDLGYVALAVLAVMILSCVTVVVFYRSRKKIKAS